MTVQMAYVKSWWNQNGANTDSVQPKKKQIKVQIIGIWEEVDSFH